MTETRKWTRSEAYSNPGTSTWWCHISSIDGTQLLYQYGGTSDECEQLSDSAVSLLNAGEAYPALVEAAQAVLASATRLILAARLDALRALLPKVTP